MPPQDLTTAKTREVLGKDKAGRVVISTDDGLVIVQRSTRREIVRLALPVANGIRAHVILGMQQTMVKTDQMRPRQLIVARL